MPNYIGAKDTTLFSCLIAANLGDARLEAFRLRRGDRSPEPHKRADNLQPYLVDYTAPILCTYHMQTRI